MNTDEIAVMIIANAGESKSLSMGAIDEARKGNFTGAHEMLEKGREALLKAHEIHTKLLVEEARENSFSITMILVHSSNHLSVAEITNDLALEFIGMYEEVKKNA